uniref:MmgE/PrpD family protein n=1 Tax=Sphaerisporangium perillae TaxID=2935860 RepID=UPI00200EAAB3|nr:MmgE/PrpD family protein [Sphaerisporangium perillae]
MTAVTSAVDGLACRAARGAAGLDVTALDSGVLVSVKAHLLDCLGMILAGAADERVGRAVAAPGPADVPFVLSLACSALGLDDFDEATRAHPGAVLVPALAGAAVAARHKVSGADMAAALVAGYQLFGGLGKAVDAGTLHLRGHHPSSFLGVPTSALAVCRMLRSDVATSTDAIGIGASLSCGITEFDERETMRAVQTAWAASAGLRAARLAEAGFHASPAALEAPGGLVGRTGTSADAPAAAELPTGPPWHIEQVSFKPYPHFSDLHPVSAVLIDMLGDQRLPPEQVEVIGVRLTPSAASRLFDDFPPQNAKQAKRSARFALASCVVAAHRVGRGSALLGAFSPERLADADVLDLAARITVMADLPPQGATGSVTVTLTDGRTWSGDAGGYPGDGRDPALRWGWSDAVARYGDLCTAASPDPQLGSALLDMVDGLERVDDVRPALQRLRRLVLR